MGGSLAAATFESVSPILGCSLKAETARKKKFFDVYDTAHLTMTQSLSPPQISIIAGLDSISR